MKTLNKKAFTLVELIIVIAVIAILAAGTFVATRPQKRIGETNDAQRKNDAQALEQAIKVLAADNGVVPSELKALTENIPFAIVKAGGEVSGTYSCTALGTSIDKKDISSTLLSVIPAMPMDPELSASSNETGYYIVRRGSSYDIEPCNTYKLAATFGDKQMCGDGYCGSNESCSSCAQDCGACPPPAPCDGKSIGQASSGGALCAGSYGGFYYMTTPGGCTDSSTPTCAGGTDTVTKYYQNTPHAYVAAISDVDGVSNTNALAARADTPAAKYCQDMSYGTYTDWFLPSKNESNSVLYTNKTALGGFTDFYWTSTEGAFDYAWYQYFGAGWFNDWDKTYLFNIRCVRKY